MIIYRNYNNVAADGTVVTLGNFDGFHIGHQRILAVTKGVAAACGLPALVMTFLPHPRRSFKNKLPILTPLAEKTVLLAKAGADITVIQPFTLDFAKIPPRQFIEKVVFQALKCRHLVVGYDYSFGNAGAGNTSLIERLTAANGVGCDIIEPVRIEGQIVSSSAIRRYIQDGAVEKARSLLGRPYSLSSNVATGHSRGRTMGFPTANLYPSSQLAQPKPGVYLVRASWANQVCGGVANLGYQPTFSGQRLALEVFLLGFRGNLYGKRLKVEFLQRLREERKFPSCAVLVEQLKRDVELAKTLLAGTDVLNL